LIGLPIFAAVPCPLAVINLLSAGSHGSEIQFRSRKFLNVDGLPFGVLRLQQTIMRFINMRYFKMLLYPLIIHQVGKVVSANPLGVDQLFRVIFGLVAFR